MSETTDLKQCGACLKDLPIDCFGTATHRKDGRNLYCKSCINEKKEQRDEHGLRGYWAGCRCSNCRGAKAEYERKRYEAQKADFPLSIYPVEEERPIVVESHPARTDSAWTFADVARRAIWR